MRKRNNDTAKNGTNQDPIVITSLSDRPQKIVQLFRVSREIPCDIPFIKVICLEPVGIYF